jgi:Tfp pilus assembly protein PilE
MPLHPLKSAAGFTYIAALAIVMIMGIMMGVAGQSWKMIMAREQEAELLARGDEIRAAMKQWYRPSTNKSHNNQVDPGAFALRELDDLCKDPRLPNGKKYIRCAYENGRYKLKPDPITKKEWRVIKDPNIGIIGVASSSEKEPIKQANFPKDYIDFEGKKKYSDWEFVWNREPKPKGTTVNISGIQTTGMPTTGSSTAGSQGRSATSP